MPASLPPSSYHTRNLTILGMGDSHTNGQLEVANPNDASIGVVGVNAFTSPLDFIWNGTGNNSYFRADSQINSPNAPSVSNDQMYTAVGTGLGSWLTALPGLLRPAYQSINKLTIANLGVGGSSAYTWAGEQAYGYVQAAGVPNDGDTIAVGGKTYTFRTSPAVVNDVLIGTATGSTLNLMNAINGEGSGFFAGTTANAQVFSSTTSATTYSRVISILSGTGGNALTIVSNTTARACPMTSQLAAGLSVNLATGSATSALYANGKALVAGIGNVDIVTATLGSNDANRTGYRGRGTQTELTTFVAKLHSDFPAAKVILWRPLAISTSGLAISTLSGVVVPAVDAVVAANPSFVSSVDMFSIGAGGSPNLAILNTTGGLHATPYGYSILTQLMAAKIGSLLALT
jgi:lysophospholipase L1-like esterase